MHRAYRSRQKELRELGEKRGFLSFEFRVSRKILRIQLCQKKEKTPVSRNRASSSEKDNAGNQNSSCAPSGRKNTEWMKVDRDKLRIRVSS